jgi:hypothetical protein
MATNPGDTGWTSKSSTGVSTDQSSSTSAQPGQMVQQAAQRAQASGNQLADQAKKQISNQLQSQKDRATGTLSSMAQALQQTSQQLQDQGQAPISNYAAKVAEGVERVTNYLNDRDIADLRGEAERIARTQPMLFLAGAFAIGWFGARFFKSSTPAQWSNQNTTNYPGSSQYSGSSYGSGDVVNAYNVDRYGSPSSAVPSTYPQPAAPGTFPSRSSSL